jgi:transposase
VFDPFHVCLLGSKATNQVRLAEYNKHGRSGADPRAEPFGRRARTIRKHMQGVLAAPELGLSNPTSRSTSLTDDSHPKRRGEPPLVRQDQWRSAP